MIACSLYQRGTHRTKMKCRNIISNRVLLDITTGVSYCSHLNSTKAVAHDSNSRSHNPATKNMSRSSHSIKQQNAKQHKHNLGAEWGSRTLRKVCYRAFPGSAMCVQNLDDSRGFAIRITYRISLRSSSLWEPRHPLLKVVRHYKCCQNTQQTTLPHYYLQ